jgi:hypothetical protein
VAIEMALAKVVEAIKGKLMVIKSYPFTGGEKTKHRRGLE